VDGNSKIGSVPHKLTMATDYGCDKNGGLCEAVRT
jgi:hypothetical protein